MSVEKLERVLWLLRKQFPDTQVYTWFMLIYCIMTEIGTDRRTYTSNRTALKKLGWIKSYKTRGFTLTNADLTGDSP